MILVRTPLRISLFGGGSDLPNYYENHSGAVLSTTIDRYMYVAVCSTSLKGIKLVYSDIELADSVDQLKHSRVRECLNMYGISSNIEISSFSEIPTAGTGLGSSSTFTVGLINALSHIRREKITKYELAELACSVEIDRCKDPIGKQDQYAAAFGGMNVIMFSRNGAVVSSLNATSETLSKLNNNLLLFYTNIKRSAADILRPLSNKGTDEKYINTLGEMVDIAYEGADSISSGNIDRVGKLLHRSWLLKKSLSENITNSFIDSYYQKAIRAGAIGGKVVGAGGGGFLMFYVPEEKQSNVRSALSNLKEFKFNFEDTGSKVVYYEND